LIDIGKTAWIPFLSADLGNLAGGAFTQALVRRKVPLPVARKVAVAVFISMMTAAIPAVLVSSAAWAIAFVCVATFGYTGSAANTLAFPADVFPRNMVGSVYGLASMGSGFGGILFGWLTGIAVDHFGYTPVFIAYGMLPLITVAIVVFLLGPLRPDPRFEIPA
jgi:ACS family hexuronate transporter-like MFS transporter